MFVYHQCCEGFSCDGGSATTCCGNVGTDCDGSEYSCCADSGLICDLSNDGKCKACPVAGEVCVDDKCCEGYTCFDKTCCGSVSRIDCDTDHPCCPGLICDTDKGYACKACPKAGDECVSDQCCKGYSCDSNTNKCM